MTQVGNFFAVAPKTDCPHCTPENICSLEELADKTVNDPCFECGHQGENWICLKPGCGTVACSRYVAGHMVNKHYVENPTHCIVLSFADFSYWCYECDSYVVHELLKHVSLFYEQKFPKHGGSDGVKDAIVAADGVKNKVDQETGGKEVTKKEDIKPA